MRKAEEKATSGSLLAKLHYGVVQLLEEGNNLLQTHSYEWNDLSERLRVSEFEEYNKGTSYLWPSI